jgi:hypothetical protein
MITMPDGSMRPFTMTALGWMTHDTLVETGFYPSEWLIQIAWEASVRMNKPFEMLLPTAIALVQRERASHLAKT